MLLQGVAGLELDLNRGFVDESADHPGVLDRDLTRRQCPGRCCPDRWQRLPAHRPPRTEITRITRPPPRLARRDMQQVDKQGGGVGAALLGRDVAGVESGDRDVLRGRQPSRRGLELADVVHQVVRGQTGQVEAGELVQHGMQLADQRQRLGCCMLEHATIRADRSDNTHELSFSL